MYLLAISNSVLYGIMLFLVLYLKPFYSSNFIIFIRSFLSLLILTPLVYKKIIPLLKTKPYWLYSRSIFGSLGIILLFFNVQEITISNAMIINSIAPVLILILEHFFYQRKITFNKMLGSLFLLLSVVILYGPTSHIVPLHNYMIGFLGALCFSLSIISIEKSSEKNAPVITVFFLSLTLLPLTFLLKEKGFVVYSTSISLILLTCALLGLIVQLILMNILKNFQSSQGNAIMSLAVLWSGLLEIIFQKAEFSLYKILSYLCIFLGIYLIHSKRKLL